MGKRSAKGKEKKLQRKAENEKVIDEKREIGHILARASEIQDLLGEYPAFQHYRRNALDLDLKYYHSHDLPQNVQDWAFSLCKANMEAIYNTSWGWSDTDKRDELTAPEARFLVAFEKGGSEPMPMAYVHFRWEDEDGVPILYCYEIQLEGAVQRKGLGRFLMKYLELIGRKAGVHEVMLTVMKANTAAAAMYAKLGYEEHADQPEPKEGEDAPSYTILTKRFPAAAAAQRALRPVTNAYQLENIIFG